MIKVFWNRVSWDFFSYGKGANWHWFWLGPVTVRIRHTPGGYL